MLQPNQTGITKDSGEKSVSVALVTKELHVTCHKKNRHDGNPGGEAAGRVRRFRARVAFRDASGRQARCYAGSVPGRRVAQDAHEKCRSRPLKTTQGGAAEVGMYESCQPPRVRSTAIGDSLVIQKDAGREASIKDAWLSAQPLRALAFAWSRAVATQLPCFQVVAFPVPIRSEHGLAATSPWRPDLAGGYHEGMETDAANTLQRLVGRRISEVRLVHDYLQVVFQDTTLSIYSPTTLSHNGELQPMGLLVGKQLMATTATIIELVMNFGDGLELHVVLDSRTGPEILAVVEPGHPIVVWN